MKININMAKTSMFSMILEKIKAKCQQYPYLRYDHTRYNFEHTNTSLASSGCQNEHIENSYIKVMGWLIFLFFKLLFQLTRKHLLQKN